jgi:hypothetical protein
MALTILPALQEIFAATDASDSPLEEIELAGRLHAAIGDLGARPPDVRKGAFAVIGALEFQRKRLHATPTWDMYWQPLGSIGNQSFPDVAIVDDEILTDWIARSSALAHPVLRARFSDLAWEIGRYRRNQARQAGTELPQNPGVGLARQAIDSYLDAIERRLVPEHLHAWFTLSRAIELAASISDPIRIERAKEVLFDFQAACRASDPKYIFWPFDDIVWEHARVLALTEHEKAAIVAELERVLALRSDISDPQSFDPFTAQDAADRLRRWRTAASETAEAERAASTAGLALERISAEASSLTATAWLSQLLRRYHEAGDATGAARVEQQIRDRAPGVEGEMRRISVPLEITHEEVVAYADRVAGESLSQGFRNFAVAGTVGEEGLREMLRRSITDAPLFSAIPISIYGADGFPVAEIGSIEGDIEGRTLEQGARHIGFYAPFLNVILAHIVEKHGLDLERFISWLSQSPVFLAERMPLIREGLAAWFAEDFVKEVHVLVPQIEAATRELLSKIGGSVRRPDPHHGGFRAIGLGEVLTDPIFQRTVPPDIRFYLRVLYADSRGINLRNIVAHGLASPELFGRGVGNWVVHSLVLLGNLRMEGESSPQD